jgi:hypothetical protein
LQKFYQFNARHEQFAAQHTAGLYFLPLNQPIHGGSTSTVNGGAAKKPARSAKLFRTTLTGTVEPYHEPAVCAGIRLCGYAFHVNNLFKFAF